MVNTKSFLCALFVAFLVLIISFFNYLNSTNLNSTNLIEHALSEFYDESIQINIIDTYDACDDFTLVVYQYGQDNKIGYSTVSKDQFSRYHIEKQVRQEQLLEKSPGIYVSYIYLCNEQQKSNQFFVVLNQNPALSKIELPYEWCALKYWFLDEADCLIE